MADSKVKMGRPPVPDSKRIDRRIAFMVRESEEKKIKSKAAKEGLTTSEWCRKATVEAAGGSID